MQILRNYTVALLPSYKYCLLKGDRLLVTTWAIVPLVKHPSVTENSTFRSLCSYLAACLPDYSGVYHTLPQSGHAIKCYVLTWYDAMRQEVMSQLCATHTKIHFPFDMWSGPNQHAYQAIVARWIAHDG